MFLSRSRRVAHGSARRHAKAVSQRRRPMFLEPLESRLAPASASFNLPATGFSGNGAGGMILNVPVKVGNLVNGLGAANIALSFPTGVFNFPVGGNAATGDVA